MNEQEKSIKQIVNQLEKQKIDKQTTLFSFENWRQLACYSGVAPFEYSSAAP